MSSTLSAYYSANRERFLDGLKEFLRIPSVSTLPQHKPDVQRAAEFLRSEFEEIGLDNAKLIDAGGNPLVYGEWLGAPGKPTLLLYGHYDVQPSEPDDEWDSPPFEPTVRNENIYARGAVDDKGQVYLQLKAVEGHLKTSGKLPINIKFLLEGEEETGGTALENYLREHGRELGADAALICDTEMFAPELPTICTGLRGMIYTELEVRGARTDLHSGMYGGVAPNPLQAIAEIITGLKGPDGKVLIPSFYDDIKRPSDAELEAWRNLPFDEKEYLDAEIGSTCLTGEDGYSALERTWARPTLEVHGIRGGFVGEGAKTVIPGRASVKISMRLVPEMDPEKISRLYKERVEQLTPKGIQVKVKLHAGSPASVVDTDNRFIQAAVRALNDVFKKDTVYMRSGGSIPVVGQLREYAGIPSVLMGFGLPDDNLHAPNEKFHLPNFYRGIETVGRYLEVLGE